MIELEHSPLGGSSAYRFLVCVFSFLEHRRQLVSGTFVEIPTEFSTRGVAAHELAAKCLIEGTEPFEHIGREYSGFRVGWPDEIDPDPVSVYVDHCRSIMARFEDTETTFYVERTFHLPEIHSLFKGTVDFGAINGQGIWLVDYKNGEGVGVSAVDSPQLKYYALLLAYANWHLVADLPPETPVHLAIVQPNFYGLFEDPETWTTTLGEVLEWGDKALFPVMDRLMRHTDDPRPEDATPGSHCQFCPVMLHCPSLRQSFEDYANGDEDFVTMLTDQELSDLYAKREFARRFMTSLERAVYARKVTGGNIPTAKLVEKKVARVWKPGAIPVLVETFGDKAYAPRKELSPAGIEKLSSRGKDLAKEWGYKPETNALTIAPLTDPRAEAKPRTNDVVYEKFAQDYSDAGF